MNITDLSKNPIFEIKPLSRISHPVRDKMKLDMKVKLYVIKSETTELIPAVSPMVVVRQKLKNGESA